MSIKVKILFFAKSREIVGKQVSVLEVPCELSYEKLHQIIVDTFNLQQIQSNIILALNEEYCIEGQNICLKEGDEIAVIPPLSGDDAMECVAAPNCGAVSIFVGTTRNNFENKNVISLEYEAYEGMAEKTIQKICIELRKKWQSIQNIAIYHRLGIVLVKESSVVIAISSPHRKDSLEAVQFCIDTLKKSVPIWKKEIYEESESKWKENAECPWTTVKNKREKTKFVFKPRVECTNTNISSHAHLVQITCSSEEINRRINTFINRKREQVNQSNIRDFCGLASMSMDNSCARIDSKLIRLKNTKSHLRSQRVFNDLGAYNPLKLQTKPTFLSEAMSKRIEYIEDNLDIIKPVSSDIYERIKKIEDRILFLETLSPEYAHFWNKDSMFLRGNTDDNLTNNTNSTAKKQTFSLEYVDNLLYELEKQNYKTSV